MRFWNLAFYGVVSILAVLIAAPARSQFEQYPAPSDFEESTESMQELLETAIAEARWRVGRTYLDPWIGLRDTRYIDYGGARPGDERVSDFTATLGAGLRLYRPVGAELTVAAHALPEYTWWEDAAGRSRLNGRYGAGLFGHFGRLGFELAALRAEASSFVSRELEELVDKRSDEGRAEIEVNLVGGLTFLAGGSLRRFRFLADEETPAGVEFLEREEEVLRAGLRFPLGGGVEVGLGVEESTVDFEPGARDRSNTGTSPILAVDFEGSTVVLSAELALRDLEPQTNSSFVPYQGVSGSARISFEPISRTQFQLFGDRNLVYSLDSRWSYYEDSAYGAGISTSLGSLASVRLFALTGTDDYRAPGLAPDPRQDDFDAVGVNLRFRVRGAEILLGVRRTEYDSSRPDFDRDVTVFRTGIKLGGSSSPWG